VTKKHNDHSPKALKLLEVFTVDRCTSLTQEFGFRISTSELRKILTDIQIASESIRDSDKRKASSKETKAIYADIAKHASSLNHVIQSLGTGHVIPLTKESVSVDDLERLETILPELVFTASHLSTQPSVDKGRRADAHLKYLCRNLSEAFMSLALEPNPRKMEEFILHCFDALNVLPSLGQELKIERVRYHLKDSTD